MTFWNLISVTHHGFATTNGYGRSSAVQLENPNAEEWLAALDQLDRREERSSRDPVPVVLAVPTDPEAKTVGKAVTLKRCKVCDQLQAPRRRHACDRHHDPRVGDLYHRTNAFWRWIGEGEYDLDKDHRQHPHLFREERTVDVYEITEIKYEAAWSYEGENYPAQVQIVTKSIRHERGSGKGAEGAEVITTPDDAFDAADWRDEIGTARDAERRQRSAFGYYGWALVAEGPGASLSEALGRAETATEDFSLTVDSEGA